MNKVLIDSDVILDLLLNREPFAEDAAQLLTRCEQKQVQGFVTPIIFSNLYYVLRKLTTHEKIIQELKKLLDLVDILHIDKPVIAAALQSKFKDFEDALQSHAAENQNNIKVIVTRNTKDYKHSSIAVMTPGDYLKL